MAEVGRDLWRSPCPGFCSRRVICSRLPRIVSRQLSKTPKVGDSTASLGHLCHYSVTLTAATELPMLGGTSCVLVCAHCRWSCHRAPLSRAWLHPLHSLHPPSRCLHPWVRSPEPPLPQAEHSQCSLPFLRRVIM